MKRHEKKILFLVNAPWFFISHRLPLAVAAKNLGYEVHVATSHGSEIEIIKSQGLNHHTIPFTRSAQNLFSNIKTFVLVVGLFKSLKPDIVHLVTIKPVIFGGIAARMIGIKSVVAAISGLGTVFIDNSIQGYFRRIIVLKLYKEALRHSRLAVIFQNLDDCNIFLEYNLIGSKDIRIIRGSGVKLSDYPYIPEPNSIITVVMASRLLRDKGVFEFIEAAKILKSQGKEIRFCLIGEPDNENKSSISAMEYKKFKADGFVELLGFRQDISNQYASAHIVCLPSYREGLPKSLIEAAACGRAVVTTDVPGCRDAITPGITGLLCSIKDPNSLARAIQELIDDPCKRQQMGRAGRDLAEAEFAIEKIIEEHIKIYDELISDEH